MSLLNKIALLLCAIGLLAAGCSNIKNTAATRAFHNLTAHYNVIFEAQQSYDKGILAIEDGLNVNYTEMLPVWKLDDPQAPGSTNVDTTMDDVLREINTKRY